jgi:predicted alpha/beta-hydrolase family hydrolase
VTLELDTPHGPARVHLEPVESPVAALVLGHGAGGGVGSTDLVAAAGAARSAGLAVALVEQPYRVAGRRSPAPARQLDEAWAAVVEQLCAGPLRHAGSDPGPGRTGHVRGLTPLPLVTGGRSSGARVACRTAAETGAVAVLCLAFPLHPPGRPEKSRFAELDAVRVPALVVQGESDPFGMPPDGPDRTVVRVPGSHALRNGAAVAAAVTEWLTSLPAFARIGA